MDRTVTIRRGPTIILLFQTNGKNVFMYVSLLLRTTHRSLPCPCLLASRTPVEYQTYITPWFH